MIFEYFIILYIEFIKKNINFLFNIKKILVFFIYIKIYIHKMSEKLIFLHDLKHRSIDNDKKMTHEEFVIHGSKGLTIKYFHKDDKTSEKIVISERDGKYMMKSTIGESHEEKELSKDELVDLLTKNKSLKCFCHFLSFFDKF